MTEYKEEFDQLVDQVFDHILNEGRSQSKTDVETNDFIQSEIEGFRKKLSNRLRFMLTAQLEIVKAMIKTIPIYSEKEEAKAE